jgi:hypothetical protein
MATFKSFFPYAGDSLSIPEIWEINKENTFSGGRASEGILSPSATLKAGPSEENP